MDTSSIGRLNVKSLFGVILISLVGTIFVFIALLFMNKITGPAENTTVGPVIDFTVPPPQPTPPREKQEEPRRETRRTTQRNIAPLPDLGGSLSGIQIDLPGFEAAGVQTISESLLGDLDNVALTEDAVDTPPSFRTRIVPIYPERAKQREIEGNIIVSALIGTDGKVKSMQILESDPAGIFDEAVLTALSQSTFEPASYRGNPVETWVNIPFPFRLN